MDLDGYVTKLNLWREDIEKRLAALEEEKSVAAQMLSNVEQILAGLQTKLEAMNTPTDPPPPPLESDG